MFFIIEKSEESTFEFSQSSVNIIQIMGTQRIVNLINGADNENSKFTRDITVKRRNAADTADTALGAITQAAFKNCVPFEKCLTEIDGTLADEANFINIAIPMYNLIEYSDNYSDTSGSLWRFKRDEIANNANLNNDDNAPSFKYKASSIGNTENNGTKIGVKIVVPLKSLSRFWRSLEMP